MRILFASMPADGHFNPLTGIAAHLILQGHDIRWYAGPEYGRKLEKLGMPYFPYRRATEVTGGNLNSLFPERERLRGPKLISFDLEKFFAANVDNHFQDIAEIRNDFPFEILLCDGALYAEKLVAEVLGVRVFAVGMTMVMPNDDSPPPFFGLRPAKTIIGRTVHRVVRRMLASTMRDGASTYNEVLARHGIAPIPPDGFPHGPLASARRVFLNGSPGLEFPGYKPLANAEYVGPLVPARGALRSETPMPAAVLAPARRWSRLSQGTVDNSDPGKLIVSTLDALKDGPYVVVVTTAGNQTEQLRQRFAAPNVVIEDFINYEDLFPHVDVFVTNGGFGSVLAAMRHGVPVVAAGRSEGKNDINARLGYNRLGVDLRTEHPRPARILSAVRRVLDDPTYATNVAALRAELDSYDPMGRIEAALRESCLSPHGAE
jgi:UDP:flavonoid glycosyltransferase YjiC (YdhE family)